MGQLTRNYNWQQTSLGSPDSWPQSLRTTVSIVLNSKFPMFLFWGEERLCFYNDAYRPSLGNEGKHPFALGKPGADVWPEIWPAIQPQIDQVLSGGEATWWEDQFLPIYRNGRLEDVYWTYSYSPVKDESGNAAGVFVTCTETTNKVESIKSLTISEQRFLNLVREATVGIIILMGEDMRVAMVNDSYSKLLARSKEALLGKNLFDVIPEAEVPFKALLNGVRTTGNPLYLYDQFYRVYANGKPVEGYINIIYQPYKEADGAITGVLAIIQDVTESVMAKKKIEETTRTLGLALEIGGLGVFTIDLTTKKKHYSERIAEWFGLGSNDHPLSEILSRLHPDDQPFVAETLERTIANEWDGRHDMTYRIVHPQSNTLLYLRSIGQVQFEEAEAVSISGIIQDITPQIIAGKERLAAVFNASQSGMFTFAPVRNEGMEIVDFRFVITNPSFATYVGQTPEVLNGALGSTWFPGYLTNGVFDMYKHTFETGETKRQDVHYGVDGHDLYLDLMSTKVGDEVLVTFTDYTALKKAQLQLERSVDDLQRSNAALEEFAYAASHDMKEPIRKIHFFADRLKNNLSNRLTPEEAAYFSRMEDASKRMGTLIDDLLSYSEVTMRKDSSLQDVDLNAVLKQVTDDLDLVVEEKKAQLHFQHLPVVTGHPRQLQQAFQNLVSNALKFQPPGVSPQVSITAETVAAKALPPSLSIQNKEALYHLVSVSDNGIGFDTADAERIFNVFTRLHGNAEYRGTGVGLSIVRKVAENHNGLVWASSRPGDGAVFHLALPVSV